LTEVTLHDHLVEAIEEAKGQDLISIDVADLTSITDYMLIVSGTSSRHVRSLADQVVLAAKEYGEPIIGVEGRENYEWVLVDLGDVLVHVMQKEARSFYELERLWSDVPVTTESNLE